MSLRKRIDKKCKDCIYDPAVPGTWRQQVALCTAKSCPLWDVRAAPTLLYLSRLYVGMGSIWTNFSLWWLLLRRSSHERHSRLRSYW